MNDDKIGLVSAEEEMDDVLETNETSNEITSVTELSHTEVAVEPSPAEVTVNNK